jgi:hypothetical protein
LINKRYNKNCLLYFSSVFGHPNPGSGLGQDSLEMLDPDQDSMYHRSTALARTVKSFKNGYVEYKAKLVESTWYGDGV